MESHTNYEDFDDMENPDQFTESQEIPSEEHQVNETNGTCYHCTKYANLTKQLFCCS